MIYVGNKRYSLYVGNTRRKAITGKPLPYDAEIEYLESTGTQHIELDYFSGNKLEIKLKAHVATGATEMDYISNQSSSTTQGSGRFVVGSYKPNTYAVFAYSKNGNNGDVNALMSGYSAGQIIEIDAVFDTTNNNKYITVNGTQSQTAACRTITNSTHKICVFSGPPNSENRFHYSGKMYYLQLLKDNVLWYDLIPVRVGQVGYMYDKISGQLFGNAGTGDFVLGNDIVEIDYLESNGTQYIDTLFYPRTTNPNIKAEVNSCFFGFV